MKGDRIKKNQNALITIQPFDKRFEQEIVRFILNIQQNEFNIPITAADQPDLMNIPGVYQKKCGNFWVAVHRACVVGTIALLDIGNHVAVLRKMFVADSFRGKNVGLSVQLLKTMLAWSEKNGVKEIFLGTTEKFLAAHRFYEKNGFVEITQTKLPEAFPVMKVDRKFYKFQL